MKISLEQYLKRLSSDLRYPELYTLVAPKHYKLHVPDIEPIEIFETDESIEMISIVGRLIDQIDEEKFFSYIMQANYLGQGTGHSALGIHPDQRSITLSCLLFFDVDYHYFKEKIEEVVNYTDYFLRHLAEKIPTFLKES